MTDAPDNPMTVLAGERGVVRVFALTIEAGGSNALRAPRALDMALGVHDIDPAYVEIFPITDLDGVGLAAYLTEGCGVPKAQVAPDASRLDATQGHVMVVRSRAFGDRAVTLRPAAQLELIGTYTEQQTDWTPKGPIETASAHARIAPSLSPRAARARASRIGGTIFAVFMVLIALVLYLVMR